MTHYRQMLFGILVLSLTVISALTSTFHKCANHVSIIFVIYVESGIISFINC